MGVKVAESEGVGQALGVMLGVWDWVAVRDTVGVREPPPPPAADLEECLEGEEGGEAVGLRALKVAASWGVDVGCAAVAVFPRPSPPLVGVWLREGVMEGEREEEGLRLDVLHLEKVEPGEDVRVELPHLLTVAVTQWLTAAVKVSEGVEEME